MPIFVPTQGQGALYPLRTPQASQVQFNPLNTLGAASIIQGNKRLEQQKALMDQRQRELDLREKIAVLENQQELFKTINGVYATGAAQTKASKGSQIANSYGLSSEFYGDAIGSLDEQTNAFYKQAMTHVGNMRTADDAAQANGEISRMMLDFNRNLRGNTQYQEYLRNQNSYDKLVDNIDKELGQGKSVNPLRQQQLYEAMVANGQGKRSMRPSDFNLSDYIFDDKQGQARLESVTEKSLGEIDFAQYATESPDGFIAIEEGKLQKDFDTAVNNAYNVLSRDPNVRGMAETLAFTHGTKPEDEIRGMIEDAVTNDRNELDRQITNIKLQNQGKAEVNKEVARIQGVSDEITAAGYSTNPIGPESADEALRKIANVKDSDKDGRLTLRERNGNLEYVMPSKDLSKEDDRVIATFPKNDPLTKRITPQGVELVNSQTGEATLVNDVGTKPQAGIDSPNLSQSDNDALSLVEAKEVGGGGNVVNANDGGLPSIGPLQYRGQEGADFLKFMGIEGYDVTKPLSKEDSFKLTDELNSRGDLVEKSREYFKEKRFPDTLNLIEKNLPELKIDEVGAGVKNSLYSMSINHSPKGQEQILKRAAEDLQGIENPDETQIVNAIQDARKDYVAGQKIPVAGWTDKFKNQPEWQGIEVQMRGEGASQEEIDSALEDYTREKLKQSLYDRYDTERIESLDLIGLKQEATPPATNQPPSFNFKNFQNRNK